MTIIFAIFSMIFLGFSFYWWWKYETAKSENAIRKEYIEYLQHQAYDDAKFLFQQSDLHIKIVPIEQPYQKVEFSDN